VLAAGGWHRQNARGDRSVMMMTQHLDAVVAIEWTLTHRFPLPTGSASQEGRISCYLCTHCCSRMTALALVLAHLSLRLEANYPLSPRPRASVSSVFPRSAKRATSRHGALAALAPHSPRPRASVSPPSLPALQSFACGLVLCGLPSEVRACAQCLGGASTYEHRLDKLNDRYYHSSPWPLVGNMLCQLAPLSF
jgi:hypothetical protein